MTPDIDDVLDLVAQRTALLLSIAEQKKVVDHYSASSRDKQKAIQKEWIAELAVVEAELFKLGVLKEREPKEVGLAELVTLRGSMEVGAGSADRPCEFCGGAGERVVDTEIDGFVYEVTIDCPH